MTPAEIADWVGARFYGSSGHISGKGIAAFRDDRLAGALAFHDWQPERGTIEVSAASAQAGWLTPRLLRDAMGYVFDQLGCQLLIARTGEGNSRVRSICRRLGAVETAIPRARGRGEAEIILTLTEEAWREYEGRHAPTIRASRT